MSNNNNNKGDNDKRERNITPEREKRKEHILYRGVIVLGIRGSW